MTNEDKIIDLIQDIDDGARDCPYEEDILDATGKIADMVCCDNDKIKELELALWLACEGFERKVGCGYCPNFRCKGEIDDRIKCPELLKQYFINKAKEKNNE